jgi:hypothetical protein
MSNHKNDTQRNHKHNCGMYLLVCFVNVSFIFEQILKSKIQICDRYSFCDILSFVESSYT